MIECYECGKELPGTRLNIQFFPTKDQLGEMMAYCGQCGKFLFYTYDSQGNTTIVRVEDGKTV